jgi:hypothetical protein
MNGQFIRRKANISFCFVIKNRTSNQFPPAAAAAASDDARRKK